MSDPRWNQLLNRYQVLAATGRLNEAVELLERSLGLDASHYRDPDRLFEWSARFWAGIRASPYGLLECFLGLIQVLAVVFRGQDGLRLLAAALGLEPAALRDADRVIQGVEQSDLPRDPSVRVFFAMSASSVVGITGETAPGRRLLEHAAGLEKEDYASPRSLRERLESGLDGVDLEVRTAWLTLLNASLLDQGRTTDARNLFIADLGIPTTLVDSSPGHLAGALKRRLSEISDHGAASYPRGLARALAASGEIGHAVAVLEVYAGLDDACYEGPEILANRLRELFSRTNGIAGLSFVNELIGNLKEDGQLTKAALLLRVYVDRFVLAGELLGVFEGPPLGDFTSLFEVWLEFFGDEPDSRPLEICRRLVEQICSNLGGSKELEDRQAFLNTLGSLRRRLLTVGHRRAVRESDVESRRGLFSELAVWDAELSQRLLLERFLLGERSAIAAGQRPISGRAVADQLRSRTELDTGRLKVGEGFLSEAEFSPISDASVLEEALPASEALAQRARETSLATALGHDTLFLRATFDPRGRLLWSLWESDGKRLEVQDFGVGRESDLEALRWAVARHDLALELVHSRVLSGPGGRIFARDFRELQAGYDQLVEILETESEASTERSRRLLDRFEKDFKPTGRQVADIFAGLLRHLDESLDQPLKRPKKSLMERLFPLLWGALLTSRPDDDAGLKTWASAAVPRIQECRALTLSIVTSRESRSQTLDSATRRFLDEVSAIWRLDQLVLPPERDVVFQVDELLHSVPLAFLSVGGRPLYQQARSIRTSLGLLMDISQLEQGRAHAASPGRLLTLSYCQPDDKVLAGMALLHQGLVELGDNFGFETWAAAADPPATAGTLRAALDTHSGFDVVAICGHGHAVRAGVVLGAPDGDPEGVLWQGAGCDFSGVNWLFLVSCSIGRVKQTGERDAEGLAVELALHGARSVAAFRWPIASREAASFTREAVGRYLRGLDRANIGPLRARALNEARRACLDDRADGSGEPRASLHTIAACELYGLG